MFRFLLLLCGFRWFSRRSNKECDHTEFRAKRRAFRRKLREAFDVWDDEELQGATTDRAADDSSLTS
ncbi:hypothetical protein [Sulfoacidibacillus thermotolerans]|uniref:Uncharacterized protein n=1 Tax=Sulfoacidibacillus thermotolerans TaxID=1765684 RepID=A0A2U3D950_SULT2|nr:hypothetical protein [Sulfoacidibacillus thermotolerans]PWI57803.1 hypothetical protein BM613_06310 [Sulfoacidibacillus thermotolerans]